jgi:hypothetical protein
MRRLCLTLILFAFQSSAVFAFENPDLPECKSKDVWDAGFVLRFDLRSKAGDETAQVKTQIYQLVPLWSRRLEFEGELSQIETGACEFSLIDYLQTPTVELRFKISPAAQEIEIEALHGVKPEKWTKLECQPALIERLAHSCIGAQ